MKTRFKVVIHPSKLSGYWKAPPSKSYAQRALLMAALAQGTSRLYHLGTSADEEAAIGIVKELGAEVRKFDEEYTVKGTGGSVKGNTFFVQESGLSLRLLMPVLAGQPDWKTVHASGSLLNRPYHFWARSLQEWGAEIVFSEQVFPLHIKGPIHLDEVKIDAGFSSQFAAGVLLTMAASGIKNKHVYIVNAVSLPYIHMTIEALQKFGSALEMKNDTHYFFPENNQKLKAVHYTIEGDWSNAAFLMVAALISGNDIQISGLHTGSLQADRKIWDLLIKKNRIASSSQFITVKTQKFLPSFDIDLTHCPDLFPPLAVWAAHAEGTCYLHGVHRLTGKESNRSQTIQQLLHAFGVTALIENDTLIIHPGRKKGDVLCSSHGDHRIAMAAAILALHQEGITTIIDAEAVQKSYPDFFTHLQSLGAQITIQYE